MVFLFWSCFLIYFVCWHYNNCTLRLLKMFLFDRLTNRVLLILSGCMVNLTNIHFRKQQNQENKMGSTKEQGKIIYRMKWFYHKNKILLYNMSNVEFTANCLIYFKHGVEKKYYTLFRNHQLHIYFRFKIIKCLQMYLCTEKKTWHKKWIKVGVYDI